MNILIPHSWLLEHLETSATPDEIQKYLSLSGPSVERINIIEDEPVYDIEITTNRVDSMSIRGIAREAAVILTQAGIPSTLKSFNLTLPEMSHHSSKEYPLPKIINDPKLCNRILCIVAANVSRHSSPEWMQKRLRQIGVNIHDIVIDITNYITHELGHPCHAFDFDLLVSHGQIKVREAKKGETFTIIDGTKFSCVGGEVVFVDANDIIIDLPAIKGTKNTSINSNTKNVLFWIESLDPSKVRFASMTHAIRTVAAQLAEKGISPTLAEDTFARGIELFTKYADAKIITDTFTDINTKINNQEIVQVSLNRVKDYLGLSLPDSTLVKILKDLGFEVSLHDSMLSATPPPWRTDISEGVDIIEEVARIYGYHNLPSVLMSGSIPTNHPTDTDFTLEAQIKSFLANLGGYEVYTYSMISESEANYESRYILSALEKENQDLAITHIKIKNPLNDDLVYMRRSLWISHLPILKAQNPSFIFELANTYLPAPIDGDSTLPKEEFRLTLSSRGDQRYLKGILSAILSSLYLPQPHYEVNSTITTLIKVNDTTIGHLIIGKLSDLEAVVIDPHWNALITISRKYPQVAAIPKVAPIIEDLTFSLPPKIHMQDIISSIKGTNPLITKVILKNQYKQNATFTLYYQPQQEMNADDLIPIRKQILRTLNDNFSATLVGKL